MLVRLRPNKWVRLPGTPVELHAEYDYVIWPSDDGIWDLGRVPGRLLVRVVLPDGRKSWPRPRPPLPWRQP